MSRWQFRAYDKKEKRFIHSLWINGNGTIRVSGDGNPDKYFCLEDDLYNDRYIIQQCTGVDDRDGNLLYEGDIVRMEGISDVDTGKPLHTGTFKVIYCAGSYYFADFNLMDRLRVEEYCLNSVKQKYFYNTGE